MPRLKFVIIKRHNAEDVFRGFMREVVHKLIRRACSDNPEPVKMHNFTYSYGDLATLICTAHRGDGLLMTTSDSWNARLWTHMASFNWMRRVDIGIPGPIETQLYEVTEYGRIELLDLATSYDD